MRYFFLAFSICLGSSIIMADESASKRVESYLQSRLLKPDPTEFDVESRTRILTRPDPGTSFLRYAFGVKQHAKRLLDAEQSNKLNDVLEKHSLDHKRWHDERNALRCKFNEVLWRYAAVSDPKAARCRTELESWMRLRMIWTEQEHLAQYRFARDFWQVLTVEQQAKLIAGQWKAYAVQNTGHTRDDATAKIITRALGKPDDQAAFDKAVASWSSQRKPLHAVLQQTENEERRIVFAMDLNNERMADQASQEATAAYSSLFLAEADEFRRIVQVSYRNPVERCASGSAAAWSEAERRFAEGASQIMNLLTQ